MWTAIKHINIYTMAVLEREKRKKGAEAHLKKNFLNYWGK